MPQCSSLLSQLKYNHVLKLLEMKDRQERECSENKLYGLPGKLTSPTCKIKLHSTTIMPSIWWDIKREIQYDFLTDLSTSKCKTNNFINLTEI